MQNPVTVWELKDTTANPAPLGLLGFGMATVLFNLYHAGLYELNAMILAMGVFYGGLAQIIAGLMEWKKKNLFGMTAFCSYGLFWLSLVALIVWPRLGLHEPASHQAMGFYLCAWGVFTLIMFIGTLRLNFALQFVFASLAILFFLHAAAHFIENESITRIAGWEGIICGLSAMYAGLAQVLNEQFGRTVWPLGRR